MLEAERRGILPPDKTALLAEARKRGLVPVAPGAVGSMPTGRGGVLDDLAARGEFDARQAQPDEPRTGDFLRPVFGGRNPIAETVDLVGDAFNPASNRPVLDRVRDTANFVAAAPFQALRLPSPGQIAEGVGLGDGLAKSEQRFAENNPDLLNTIAATSAVAMQTPLGQGFRLPPAPPKPPAQATRITRQIGDDSVRAANMVDDMRELGVETFAPAVSAARRGDNSPGALTQALADKPFVGAPIQRGARQFSDDMAEAQGRIRGGYGQSQSLQGGGSNVRAGLERFREGIDLDVKALPDDELTRLSASPPRLTSFRDVSAAKYERAERFLPEDKAKAQPVGKGEERNIGGMPNTVQVLQDIKRRYGLTINKAAAARAKKGKDNNLTVGNADPFPDPRWTGSPNIDASLNSIVSAGGNWRAGLEGMREIRSMIRRVLSARPDSEVNALSRADLKRLYSSVSRDMDGMLRRLEADTRDTPQLSARYAAAREAFKEADQFYARYSETFEKVRGLLNLRSDEAVGGAILTAMRDGSRGNVAMLAQLRRALPREALDEMASALIVELGRPSGRAGAAAQEAGFSPSRWASQWNTLSDAGKRLMFGHRHELKQQLDRFARVAQGMADYEALANNSRTGVSNAVWGAVAAGGVGASMLSLETLAAVTGAALTGRAAAHFLTSPAYVRWLTRSVELQRNPRPSVVASHLRRLENMVRRDGNIDDATKRAILIGMNGAGELPDGQMGSRPSASQPAPRQ